MSSYVADTFTFVSQLRGFNL
ncbi:hypothetical protein KIPB_006842, partial [Kipferlia bialata]|eukprot:g4245.t1